MYSLTLIQEIHMPTNPITAAFNVRSAGVSENSLTAFSPRNAVHSAFRMV
jgi:hypothetical protein